MKIKTLLIVASLVVGCGKPTPGDSYTVLIDPTFSTDERAGIDTSIQDWRTHVPVTFNIVAMSCNDLTPGVICVRAVDHAEVLRRANPPMPTAWSCTHRSDNDGSIVYLDSTRYQGQDAWKQNVTHELGHAMGLAHDREGTVMCLDVTCSAINVTDADVRQWKSLR